MAICPERVAVAVAVRAGVPQGFGRGHRLIGGPGVLEQGPRDRGRDDPAIPGLRVDHPQLQVATRPHRGEQRGQVIGEVIQRGRPPGAPAAAFPVAAAVAAVAAPAAAATGPVADPVAEGQAGRRGPGRRPGPAHQHQLGVQRVSDVAVTRVTGVSSVAVAGWRPGAPRVEMPPDFLAGGPPAGRLALAERGVRERGHQHGPDVVGEAPAPAVAAGGRGIAAGVQAHLDRRGVAHHLAAPRAAAVKELLHGRVPGQFQHTTGRADRIETITLQGQARTLYGLAEGGHLLPDGRHALAEAVGGCGA